jgi:hypothetical protein
LEVTLALTERKITPALHDHPVRFRQDLSDALGKSQQLPESQSALAISEVIEEYPTDPTPLLRPVTIHEIMIAPGLETGIEVALVAVTFGLEGPVKMGGVLRERICRREVGPPSEPRI